MRLDHVRSQTIKIYKIKLELVHELGVNNLQIDKVIMLGSIKISQKMQGIQHMDFTRLQSST